MEHEPGVVAQLSEVSDALAEQVLSEKRVLSSSATGSKETEVVESSTRWRKSSRSGPGNACVEIRNDLNAVRDSKSPDGPVLTIGLHGLVETVKR